MPFRFYSDPEIMGGAPVVVGTRVPMQTLLEYLEAGDPLDEFLEDFPSVSRGHGVGVLELAKRFILARAPARELSSPCLRPEATAGMTWRPVPAVLVALTEIAPGTE